MKSTLYARKSPLPNGVPGATVLPVGPDPVKLALKVGEMVNVEVYALSRVELVIPAVALCHMICTVFFRWSSGLYVWPRR